MIIAPDISIAVPIYDEHGALPGLIEEIDASLAALGRRSDLIFVDVDPTDGSGEYLRGCAAGRDDLIVVDLGRNSGKSAALAAGFGRSRGDAVVTLDGNGQEDLGEIPALLDRLDEAYELVSGWKRDRQDPIERRFASRIFNRVTALISGVRRHDFNSGLKVYRGDRIRELPTYSEMHSYIPVLGAQRGWSVCEIPVNHRPREHGRTKFGLGRYARGMLDLLAVVCMERYGKPTPASIRRHRHLLLRGRTCDSRSICRSTRSPAPRSATGHSAAQVSLIVVRIQLFTFGLLAQ